MKPAEVKVANLFELADGQSRGFDPCGRGRDTVFIVRRGGHLHAWRDACPHLGNEGSPMAWRKDAYLNHDGTRIVCHAHGAQFDLVTGLCLLGPCLGQSLTPVPVRVGEGGEIYLEPPA
jgi:nitrite reductase/ring-hydroxylating ferredoxin subunit